MTEEEAKTKLCPMNRAMNGGLRVCQSSDCMMWRWGMSQEWLDRTENKTEKPSGYCGLGGITL